MDCHWLRLESYNDYHKMKEKGGKDRQSRPSQFEEIMRVEVRLYLDLHKSSEHEGI